MRRRLSLLIAFIGVLGLIGFAPTAEASHDLNNKSSGSTNEGTHELMPDPPEPGVPIGDCAVQGEVNIGNASGNGGVGITQGGISNKSHNHFQFVDTNIFCASSPVDDPNLDFTGNFLVDAAGGTDGPSDGTDHGEDAANGWSHSSCYDDGNTVKAPGAPASCNPPATNDKVGAIDDLYDGTNTLGPGAPGTANDCNNCGEIEVANATNGTTASCTPGSRFDPAQGGTHACQAGAADNVVMFCRGEFEQNGNICPAAGGSNVIAWGALHGTNPANKGVVLCFLTSLEFIPRNGDGGMTKKFDQATLIGDAVIWIAANNDKVDCFGTPKGKKPAT